MAEPNFATVTTALVNYVARADEVEQYAATASTGFVAANETLRGSLTGTYASRLIATLESDRATLAGLLDPPKLKDDIREILHQYATDQAIDSNAVGPDGIDESQLWEDLFDYFIAQSESLNARGTTLGAFSGSTTGNGEVVRLGTDEQAQPMEGWFAGGLTLECIQDSRTSGQEGQEFFRLYGENKSIDELSRTGTGYNAIVKSLHAGDVETYLLNPSFDRGTPAPTTGSPSSPTDVPGWTDDTGSYTNITLDFDTTYRANPVASTSWSMRFNDNTYVYQDLVADRGTSLAPEVPHLTGIALYREGSCDGSFVIRMTDADTPTTGGVSRSITISSQTNATWARYWLVATPGANNWPASFNTSDLALVFQLTGRTTGTVYLDDAHLHPMTKVGAAGDPRTGRGSMGSYISVIGGPVPWLKGDTLTATDTENGSRARVQYLLAVAGLGYLPSNDSGTETIDSGN